MQEEEFNEGETIVEENKPADFLFVLLSGRVNLTKKNLGFTKVLKAISYFGDNSLLRGEGIQTESCVTASEYVKVLALARKDWLVILENMDVKIECRNENESKNEINKMLKSSGVAVHVEE